MPYIHPDHYELINAISDYGKAQQAFGGSGGYKGYKEEPTSMRFDGREQEVKMLLPIDKEAHRKACEAWGKVNDLLDKHFKKHWLWHLFNWL